MRWHHGRYCYHYCLHGSSVRRHFDWVVFFARCSDASHEAANEIAKCSQTIAKHLGQSRENDPALLQEASDKLATATSLLMASLTMRTRRKSRRVPAALPVSVEHQQATASQAPQHNCVKPVAAIAR